MNVNIKGFLKTGLFGIINLGVNKKEVKDQIGLPDDVSYPHDDIWKYGDIEFHFSKSGRLYLIFAEYFNELTGGDRICIDPWIIRRNLTVTDAEKRLSHENMLFTTEPNRFNNPEMTDICLSSGVTLTFEKKDNLDLQLIVMYKNDLTLY